MDAKAGRNLWTWEELAAAGAKVPRPKPKPRAEIQVVNRTTHEVTYVVKRKKAA
jgi:hypothetical protein